MILFKLYIGNYGIKTDTVVAGFLFLFLFDCCNSFL